MMTQDMSYSREELIYLAKLNQQAERFEDMLQHMTTVAHLSGDSVGLSAEERNLLSVAFKSCIGSRRTAWRVIASIEQKEETQHSKNETLIRELKKKIEDEIEAFCREAIKIVDDVLISATNDGEARVFFLKMKGDHFKYMAEYLKNDSQKTVSEQAGMAYENAFSTATKVLSPDSRLRLDLCLSLSVFYYEIMNNTSKACILAKQAFDDAIAEVDSLWEDNNKDTIPIMQLIRDNLTLWTTEEAEND